MAHRTVKSGYAQLVDRLNRAPQGAPPSRLLDRILAILMSEAEAARLSQLPIRPFTARKAARLWKTGETTARKQLDALAARALLVDIDRDGETWYALPPPMAGFFEFSLMRVREDIDQQLLSELFHEYLNVEEDFVKALFTEGETQLGRVFVQEPVLTSEQAAHVLDHERATEVIETATCIGVGLCYCRHKQQHLDRACDQPLEICLTFNTSAASLTRHGHARRIDRAEGRDLLDEAWERGLVQFGENVQRGVNFICNCCGCCCEALVAQKRFAHLHPVHTTNWIPEVDDDRCTGCGKCVEACPVDAIALEPLVDSTRPGRRAARVDVEVCLGCGVCVRACAKEGLSLARREERVITPVNNAHRYVLMATQRGKLQDLIFDNRVMWSHRALAALLGSVLRLAPVQRRLAQRQLRSRFLERVMERSGAPA